MFKDGFQKHTITPSMTYKLQFNYGILLSNYLLLASVRADRAHGGCMADGRVPTRHMELILRRRSGRMKRSEVEAPAGEQAGRPGLIRLTPGWEGPFAGQRGGQSRWVQMLSEDNLANWFNKS